MSNDLFDNRIKKNFITSFHLVNYRNFQDFRLEFKDPAKPIVFFGDNGSGKSNILESFSFLAPGRGFRKSHLDEISLFGTHFWKASFHFQSRLGTAEIVIDFSISSKLKTIHYNGNKILNNELPKITSVIWLIPQMHNLFLDASSKRRDFFDRIINNFHTNHAKKLIIYEHYSRQRLNILKDSIYPFDNPLLSSLEKNLAQYAYYIQGARLETIKLMQSSETNLESRFPKALFNMTYRTQELEVLNKNEIEETFFIEYFQKHLKLSRSKDSLAKKSLFSINRVDFIVKHKEKDILAKFCSTGEQKIMLISVILSHTHALIKHKMSIPILLLDEVFLHLDLRHRNYLLEYILQNKIQTFITMNDLFFIKNMLDYTEIINI